MTDKPEPPALPEKIVQTYDFDPDITRLVETVNQLIAYLKAKEK